MCPGTAEPVLSEHERGVIASVRAAYGAGWFPMGDSEHPDREPDWVQPRVRGVMDLAPGGFHISRSLARRLRSGRFTITADREFAGVIRACAEPRPGREQTWLTPPIIALFEVLHRAGLAHSLEAWRAGPHGTVLVGGIYGLHLGSAFFAESKFSRPELGGTDASKACLARLVAHLRARSFRLLDVQMWTPHLARFGCRRLARAAYLAELRGALATGAEWGPFTATGDRAPFEG